MNDIYLLYKNNFYYNNLNKINLFLFFKSILFT